MPNNSLILFNSLKNDNHDDFIRKIFHYNSLINNTNEQGETLLHYCAFYGFIEQYYALINIGAEIKKTKKGNTLLHYASLSGKDNFLVVELLKQGISPLEKNYWGETSLHCSANEVIAHYFNMWAMRNNINILSLLDDDQNTLAHSCKIHGNLDGAHYWLHSYPELKDITNIFGKKWNQCKRKKFTSGLY